jgi:hypothetical protein
VEGIQMEDTTPLSLDEVEAELSAAGMMTVEEGLEALQAPPLCPHELDPMECETCLRAADEYEAKAKAEGGGS